VPTTAEIAACRPWLLHDLDGLPDARVVLGMGKVGHDAYLDALRSRGLPLIKARHRFEHGRSWDMPDGRILLDTYHVSFRNTNSGRLTADMFDRVLLRARELAGLD